MFRDDVHHINTDLHDQKIDTGFHGTPLVIAWLPLISLAVLIASLRWYKYSFYIHLFIALVVIGLTLFSTIHLLVDGWINQNQSNQFQKIHNVVGLIMTIWLGLQIITGILSRIVQYSNYINPNVCIWFKRIHKISSYLIMLLSKYNYLGVRFVKGKFKLIFIWLLLADLAVIFIYLILKSKYWKITQIIVDPQLRVKPRQPQTSIVKELVFRIKQSTHEFKQSILNESLLIKRSDGITWLYYSQTQIQLQNYIIFNDYVYDTKPLISRHPGGQTIIDLTNKKQVDRFLYGSHSLQLYPNMNAYSHSKDCLRLCGLPKAKIQRSCPMKGFNGDLFNAKIELKIKISNQNQVFMLHLKPIYTKSQQNQIVLKYQGFKHEQQFGQYFTLTVKDQKGKNGCTRLYTAIWCLRNANIKFMANNFPGSICRQIQIDQSISQFKTSLTTLIDIQYGINTCIIQSQYIPLVIKRYKDGQVTSKLLSDDFKGQIVMSTPMGAGLNYQKLESSGKVIIICGGTGINPFYDFIDILFKHVKLNEGCFSFNSMIQTDPLIKADLIKERSFVIYYAAETIQDITHLTRYQINQLCSSKTINFKSIFKVPINQNIQQSYPYLTFQEQLFDANIKEQLKCGKICKIYVCGNKYLSSAMANILINSKLDKQLYHFI